MIAEQHINNEIKLTSINIYKNYLFFMVLNFMEINPDPSLNNRLLVACDSVSLINPTHNYER